MASRRWAVEIPAHRRSAEDNSARAGGRQGPSTARRVGRLLKDLTTSQRLGLMQKRRVATPATRALEIRGCADTRGEAVYGPDSASTRVFRCLRGGSRVDVLLDRSLEGDSRPHHRDDLFICYAASGARTPATGGRRSRPFVEGNRRPEANVAAWAPATGDRVFGRSRCRPDEAGPPPRSCCSSQSFGPPEPTSGCSERRSTFPPRPSIGSSEG